METQRIDFTQLMIFPPGETIGEELEARQQTPAELARDLARPTAFVEDLLVGYAVLDEEVAQKLETIWGISADFWLNQERRFRAQLAEYKARLADQKQRKALREAFPSQVRNAFGLSRFKGETQQLIDKIKQILGINDIEMLLNEAASPQLGLYYRTTQSPKASDTYRRSWYLCARAAAAQLPALPQPFDRQKLIELAVEMPRYTREPESIADYLNRLEQESGTRFLHFKHFDQTRIDGACFWVQPNQPAIVFTQRHKRLDNFWFTLAHEIAHVVLHLNEEATHFVDELEASLDSTDSRENEADAQAALWLQTANLDRLHEGILSPERLREEARARGIHPAILTGAARHAGMIPQNTYRKKANSEYADLNAKLSEKILLPWFVSLGQLTCHP